MTSADSLRQVLLRSSHSVRKASQGKSTIFPVIYPPHLHREFRIAWGFSLCCNLTHSHMPDAVPVRRTNGLPRASFRFHLTMDTLAFGYALGAIPCAQDFHPLDCAHAWHTTKTPVSFETGVLGMVSLTMSYFHWKYNQLSSAIRCFTVLFGMGRSGTTSLWSSGKGFAARAANSLLGQKQS